MEYAGMHIMQGFCGGNAIATSKEYYLQYPAGVIPTNMWYTTDLEKEVHSFHQQTLVIRNATCRLKKQ
jgi:hypothetical protein